MGCLNDNKNFDHRFANIHLSGPCNRDCYFCIGQHMPGVQGLNTLQTWPLPGLIEFTTEASRLGVYRVYLTGSDTEPALYRYHEQLIQHLRRKLPGCYIGIRTNGTRPEVLRQYDGGSISVPSFDSHTYRKLMGGTVPDVAACIEACPSLTLNVCLDVDSTRTLQDTLDKASDLGFRRVNLRELYGQRHEGDPMVGLSGFTRVGEWAGNPQYTSAAGLTVTYWNVHFTEVTSLNLYANGHVDHSYSVTLGHDKELGEVKGQEFFV